MIRVAEKTVTVFSDLQDGDFAVRNTLSSSVIGVAEHSYESFNFFPAGRGAQLCARTKFIPQISNAA